MVAAGVADSPCDVGVGDGNDVLLALELACLFYFCLGLGLFVVC